MVPTMKVFNNYFRPIIDLGYSGIMLESVYKAGLYTEKEFTFLVAMFRYVPSEEEFKRYTDKKLKGMKDLAGV